MTLPLRSDWRWGVQVVSATSDPGDACSDCVGSKAFPLAREYRGPERDSVWLVWGGQAITMQKTEKTEKTERVRIAEQAAPTPERRKRPRGRFPSMGGRIDAHRASVS